MFFDNNYQIFSETFFKQDHALYDTQVDNQFEAFAICVNYQYAYFTTKMLVQKRRGIISSFQNQVNFLVCDVGWEFLEVHPQCVQYLCKRTNKDALKSERFTWQAFNAFNTALNFFLENSLLPQPTNAYENEVDHSFFIDKGIDGHLLLDANKQQNFHDRYFQWSNWGVGEKVKNGKYLTMSLADGTLTSGGKNDQSDVLCVRHLISTFEYK